MNIIQSDHITVVGDLAVQFKLAFQLFCSIGGYKAKDLLMPLGQVRDDVPRAIGEWGSRGTCDSDSGGREYSGGA